MKRKIQTKFKGKKIVPLVKRNCKFVFQRLGTGTWCVDSETFSIRLPHHSFLWTTRLTQGFDERWTIPHQKKIWLDFLHNRVFWFSDCFLCSPNTFKQPPSSDSDRCVSIKLRIHLSQNYFLDNNGPLIKADDLQLSQSHLYNSEDWAVNRAHRLL